MAVLKPAPGWGPVLELYRDAPLAARAHVRGRLLTCPLDAVVAAVPAAGPVLEVGCGHGLFSAMVAATRGVPVLGIDPDERKLAVARAAARRAAERGLDLRFAPMRAGEVPAGPWAAIGIVDVLYLLDPAAQRRLVLECATRLLPGGVLLLKEMATGPWWKYLWNLAQETVAVRILGLTRGARLAFVPPASVGRWLAERHLEVSMQALDRGYPHPHHLIRARRPKVKPPRG